jgi:RecB family exonuclease
LRLTGIPIGNAASDRAREEFLFEVAATRATSEAVFTYPERDHLGLPATPSVFLSRLDMEPEHVQADRCGPVEPERRRPAYLRESANLDAVAAAHSAVTPAAIEIFLECPFRFFLLSTLELEGAPASAGERLNAALQLEIIRESLAVHADAGPLAQAFERAFYRACARERVPAGPRTELVREGLLRTVRRLAAAALQREQSAGWQTRTNEEIECDLAGDVTIQGQIDRYDLNADGHVRLFGYRQARSRGIAAEGVGGAEEALYLAALRENYGYTPVGLTGISFDPASGRHQVSSLDSQPALTAHLDCVRRAAIGAVREIRRGCVEPRPAVSDRCAGCEVCEICRITSQTPLGLRSAL